MTSSFKHLTQERGTCGNSFRTGHADLLSAKLYFKAYERFLLLPYLYPGFLFQGGEICNINEDTPMQLCDTRSVIKPVQVMKINTLPPELIDHLGESFPKRPVESSYSKQPGNTEKKANSGN